MGTLNSDNCLFLAIDIQEKLVKMLGETQVNKKAEILAKTAKILNIPTIVTEQYPKGLGATIFEVISNLPQAVYKEKTNFSVFYEEGFPVLIDSYKRNQIVLFGIETHICVLQTAFDLLDNEYEVFVVQDASGSRNNTEHEAALKRILHYGAHIVTTEMVLFELLKGSNHPNFKEIQALIK